MATEKVTVNSLDLQRIKNELEDLFEVIREQEEKIYQLEDLEAATKVLATAIAASKHEVAETNEELYRHAREINVILNPNLA